MADGDEDAVGCEVLGGAGLGVAHSHAGNAERVLVAEYVFDDVLPYHRDLGIGEQTLLQNLLGPKRIAAMDQGHFARVVGEIVRLFDRGVAAADDDHLAIAEEEAVTGRAGRDAEAAEALLALETEPARLGAGRNDQRIGAIAVARIAEAGEGPTGQVHRNDRIAEEARADPFGLGLHLLHQPRPLHHVGKSGVVLDIGRDRHLAAGLDAVHEHRLERRPRGIDRGGKPGRTRAQDKDLPW